MGRIEFVPCVFIVRLSQYRLFRRAARNKRVERVRVCGEIPDVGLARSGGMALVV